MTKILPIVEHCVRSAFRVSKECYGGRGEKLARTVQENSVLVNTCRYSSCIMLRDMEKEHLGVFIKSTLTKESVQQLEITVVDDIFFLWWVELWKDGKEIKKTHATTWGYTGRSAIR